MHPSDSDLELYVKRSLDEDRESAVEAHILGCEECRNKLRSFARNGNGQDYAGAERRKNRRVPLDAPIRIRPMRPPGSLIEGRIVNVSKDGLKLKLPKAVEPGMTVQARIGGRIIMAEVRYCISEGDQFYVGIEVQDVFPIPAAPAEE